MNRSRKKPGRKRSTPQTKYTTAFVMSSVLAVHTNGGDIVNTARSLGIPQQTLRQWVSGKNRRFALDLMHAKRGDMADALRDAAWVALGLALGKANDASFRELMTGFGIAFDKMRILAGLPTTINESHESHVSANVKDMIGSLDREQLDKLLSAFLPLTARLPSGEPDGRGDAASEPVSEPVAPPLHRLQLPDVGEQPAREVRG